MPAVARIDDNILGTTSGEHSGHLEPHPPSTITGTISSNCSSKVFCGGKAVAFVGSVTTENDSCCGTDNGVVAEGSSKVFINNIPLARVGDALDPHNGTAEIATGSTKVFAGGD